MTVWERKAISIIETGLRYLGTRYKFGSRSGQTRTFDCSSFTQYVYGLHGIRLPRTSRQQSRVGQYVSRNNIRKGDLLFFTTPLRKNRTGIQRIGHCAIYMGNRSILHTYKKGEGVTIYDLDSVRRYYVTARRVIR